jgi:hypothetical protein
MPPSLSFPFSQIVVSKTAVHAEARSRSLKTIKEATHTGAFPTGSRCKSSATGQSSRSLLAAAHGDACSADALRPPDGGKAGAEWQDSARRNRTIRLRRQAVSEELQAL